MSQRTDVMAITGSMCQRSQNGLRLEDYIQLTNLRVPPTGAHCLHSFAAYRRERKRSRREPEEFLTDPDESSGV